MVKKVIKTRLVYIAALIILCGTVSIIALRNNYSKMTELRQAVIVADQNNGDVEKALQELRKHVYSHMNTNLSSGANAIKQPIQLKSRYERLMAGQQAAIKAQNDKVARDGEVVCAQRFPAGGFNAPRVACVQDYVAVNAVKGSAVAEDLYKFNFVSPSWTPDLAGMSLLATIVLLLIFIIGLGIKIIKRRL